MGYDYLVVAAGATHAYFGHDEWEPLAPGLKTIEDALEIRRRILLAYELAEREAALTGNHLPLNFVVVGAGPTGVELAGTLAEIARKSLPESFRHIDPAKTRILLVEAGPSILDCLSRGPAAQRREAVEHLGVEVRTNSAVSDVRSGQVRIGEEVLPAEVVLWAAGVAASPLGRALGVPVDRAGRVFVEPDLSIPAHREVFVIGDLASMKDEHGKPLPGVAPVAMQQGKFVARQIAADLAGHPRENVPLLRQRLASDHRPRRRHRAVWQTPHLRILAWLTWLFVHILFLDRLSQPHHCHAAMGLELCHLRARRAADHRRHRVVSVPSMEYADRRERPAQR